MKAWVHIMERRARKKFEKAEIQLPTLTHERIKDTIQFINLREEPGQLPRQTIFHPPSRRSGKTNTGYGVQNKPRREGKRQKANTCHSRTEN